MSAATDWSIRRLGQAYRRGETTPTAAAALLDRIAALDGRLHACAHAAPDGVMAQAEQAERELADGRDLLRVHLITGLADHAEEGPAFAGPFSLGVAATASGRAGPAFAAAARLARALRAFAGRAAAARPFDLSLVRHRSLLGSLVVDDHPCTVRTMVRSQAWSN